MNTIVALTGLVLVAAATPGPNNFAVLQIAAVAGLRQAAAAISGIVCGSLALALLVQAGLGALITRHSVLARALAIGGAAYLAYGGVRLMQRGFSQAAPRSSSSSSGAATVRSLFAFQFTNPKAWLLVVTAVAALRERGGSEGKLLITAVLLLTVIPAACLAGWALLGWGLRRATASGHARPWVTRVLGLLLVASAAALALS